MFTYGLDFHFSEKDSFPSNFSKITITNNQKKFFTFDNPYFVACCAAIALPILVVYQPEILMIQLAILLVSSQDFSERQKNLNSIC